MAFQDEISHFFCIHLYGWSNKLATSMSLKSNIKYKALNVSTIIDNIINREPSQEPKMTF